jgi:predicted PurR-regulated permease PerM
MTLTRLAALAAAAALVWFALDLFLLLVAGVLLAVLLRALARLLSDRTRLATRHAVVLVILGLVALGALLASIAADRLAEQADQLATALPAAVSDLTVWLRQYAWGQWLVEQLRTGAEGPDLIDRAPGVFGRLTDGIVAIVVAMFAGAYLAMSPEPYIRGVLHLLPVGSRERAAEVLYAVGEVMQWWLLGQLASMAVVGIVVGVGLAVIGVPLAFVLGVLAGLFEFVPFLGPLIGLAPAVLLALASSPQDAGYVLLLYGAVQTAEGYVLTPLVQQRAIEMPPVLTISAQVALSWMAGPIGLLVAVPVTAAIMVATQMLYVRDTLGEEMDPEWERVAREAVGRRRHDALRGLLPGSAPARRARGRSGREAS